MIGDRVRRESGWKNNKIFPAVSASGFTKIK